MGLGHRAACQKSVQFVFALRRRDAKSAEESVCAADDGAIWLKPTAQVRPCQYRRAGSTALRLVVPNIVFARLMDDYNLPAVPARSSAIRGVQTNSSTRSACQCWRR
jgi:hypothetical protein